MANQKGGYKHSAFTEFMKDIEVSNSRSIITLKCEKHQHSYNFKKLGVDGFLNYFREQRKKPEIVNFVLQLNKEKTNSSKKNCQVGSNVKYIAEKLKTSIFSKGKRACYVFNVLHVSNMNAKKDMKIYVITFNHKGVRGGFFIFDNCLYTFNTNSSPPDFYATEKSQIKRNINALKNISNRASKKMVIYWVRHGWSCGNMLQYTGKLKRLDMPKYTPDAQLSGLGTIQSTLLGYNPEIRKILQNATIIGSSELTRAIQTACYAMKSAGISCEEGGKCLEIIPKANESMWFMKGTLKYIVPKAIGTKIGSSAVALSYHDMKDFNKKIERLGNDYGVNMDLKFYKNFYRTKNKHISNSKNTLVNQIIDKFDNNPFFTRGEIKQIYSSLPIEELKQMVKDKLRKDHKDAIISASHEMFMEDVLPKLYECARKKAPEGEIPTVVIFGHGNYIKKIMERSSKEYNDEGIYNTGVYEVHYEKYRDNAPFVARNGRRLFPVDKYRVNHYQTQVEELMKQRSKIKYTESNKKGIEKLQNNRSSSKQPEELNREINKFIEYKETNLNEILKYFLSTLPYSEYLSLTGYLTKINKLKSPLHKYRVIKDTGSRLFFYNPVYISKKRKSTNNNNNNNSLRLFYQLPIPITGQKTGEDKKLMIRLWKKYPRFYVGDPNPEYTVNGARVDDHEYGKFNHGCLEETLVKIVGKQNISNNNISENNGSISVVQKHPNANSRPARPRKFKKDLSVKPIPHETPFKKELRQGNPRRKSLSTIQSVGSVNNNNNSYNYKTTVSTITSKNKKKKQSKGYRIRKNFSRARKNIKQILSDQQKNANKKHMKQMNQNYKKLLSPYNPQQNTNEFNEYANPI